MKVKGKTAIGDVYECHPFAMKSIQKHKLAYNSCDMWQNKEKKSDLPQFLKGMFNL
jgi:hypothetical protein